MIRVLIVSERALVRDGLRRILEAVPEITVAADVAQVSDAPAAQRIAQAEVVLVDFALPAADVVEATASLRRSLGEGRLLVLAGGTDGRQAPRLLEAGASGVLWKGADLTELAQAVGAVRAGVAYVSPALTADDPAVSSGNNAIGALSRRELEVMCFLATGMTNREIAEQLGISVKTIDTHRGHVLKKLQLRNNSDITRFAIRHGLVEL